MGEMSSRGCFATPVQNPLTRLQPVPTKAWALCGAAIPSSAQCHYALVE